MGSLLRLLTLQVVSPVLRPMIRLLVGFIAVPVFRLFVHRVVKIERLSTELTKDLEQWVRGSLVLLVATANIEYDLIGPLLERIGIASPKLAQNLDWFSLGLRLLLAVGVIEAMPDQALFSIIHPGPTKLLFPKGRRLRAVREQCWPFCKGILCRHLDRSSSVFAILSVIFGGESPSDRTVGWVCYLLAITQFLIIGLVSSRDKALDVLSEFDEQVHRRREELSEQLLPAPRDGAIRPPTRPADRDRLD